MQIYHDRNGANAPGINKIANKETWIKTKPNRTIRGIHAVFIQRCCMVKMVYFLFPTYFGEKNRIKETGAIYMQGV